MRRPPRARNEPLLTAGLVWHVILVSLLFLAGVFGVYAWAIGHGHPLELARTMALNTLAVLEIFHLFFIRNIYGTSLTWKAVKGTPVVWTTVAAITAASGSFDEEVRRTEFGKAQALAMADAPAVPLFFTDSRTGLSDQVQGFRTLPTGWWSLREAWLAQ